jgi:hypothetical protein
MLRYVALEGVDDVDDRVRADLESQESGSEDQDDTIGLGLDGVDRVEGNPLSQKGGGGGKGEEGTDDRKKLRRKNFINGIELRVR